MPMGSVSMGGVGYLGKEDLDAGDEITIKAKELRMDSSNWRFFGCRRASASDVLQICPGIWAG